MYSMTFGFLEQKTGLLSTADGPQVFMADQGNPTFITGDYSLVNSQDDAPHALTIADAPPGGAAAPEPASRLLLLTGFIATAAVAPKRAAGVFWRGSQTTI